MKDLKLGFHSFDIESALKNVSDSHFILPALQRGFVWMESDIEKLFDSIYKGYPFGSLLILQINGSEDKNITTFYRFTQDGNSNRLFGNGDCYIVEDADTKYCILDGQQRLTAIYRGIYLSSGIPNKEKCLYFDALSSFDDECCFKYANKSSYYESDKLYIKVKSLWKECPLPTLTNVKKKTNQKQNKLEKKKIDKNNIKDFVKKYINSIPADDWYKQNQNVLKNNNLINNYKQLIENIQSNTDKIMDKIVNNIARFIQTFKTENLINYHMIAFKSMTTEQKIERMLNIFIRLNNGGHKLKPSDLLYSQIATYSNDDFEVRQTFDNYISQLNNVQNADAKFKLDNFIRLLWLIVGGTSSFKNFYASNAIQPHCNSETFDKVYNSLIKARNVFIETNFKFTGKTPYNIFLPIAYYFYYKPKTTSTQDEIITHEIAKYYEVAISSGYFSTHSDNMLTKFKKAFSCDSNKVLKLFPNGVFDFKLLQNKINNDLTSSTEKQLAMSDKAIDELLNLNYETDRPTILNILYILDRSWIKLTSTVDDIDHMHPKMFKDESSYNANVKNFNIDEYNYFVQTHNLLPNLQLLKDRENRVEKNGAPLYDWLSTRHPNDLKDYAVTNNVCDESATINLDYFKLSNYKTFYNNRKEQLKKKFKEIFGL